MAQQPVLKFILLSLIVAGFGCVKHVNSTTGKRSDDVSVTSLETLVQQQAAVIQTLQTKLTATESRLSDLERIVQSQAGQKSVGFTVQFSADPVSNVGVHGTFKFDRVVSNVGGGYDPHTGIFTAPVTGLYAFFLFLMAINDGDIHVAIVKEGAQLDKVFAGGPGNSYDQGSSLLSKHMSAGEQVWVVQVTHDTTVRGDTWTVFSGFLVHAD